MQVNKRQLSHSQNFLNHPEFVKELVDKTDINSGDLVVEIGPGKGVITKILAAKAGHVQAIEVDKKLFIRLQAKFKNTLNVEIIRANFLNWPLPSVPYKVFSNPPFNLTTDIITKLLNRRQSPQTAYLIIQDKAAHRFIGDPVAQDTQMSILLKPNFEIKIITPINRRQFTPVPLVNPVLVMFKKRLIPMVKPPLYQLFKDFVVYGYNQWQPTVLQAFAKIFSPKQCLFLAKKAHLHHARPRDLKINQWLIMFEVFLNFVPETKKKLIQGAQGKWNHQQKKLQKWHRTR